MQTLRLLFLTALFLACGLFPQAARAASPTVSITSPVNDYDDLIAPANVTINATAADSDGPVSKVEFFSGTTLLGTDASSPYTFAWTGVAAGRYALTAKATDNSGAVTTSATVYITVNGPTVNGFLDKRYYPTPSSTSFMTYRLFVPANYSAATKYPIVLFLHGVGEGGTDNTKQLNNNLNGAGVFVNSTNQSAYPCIMIAPQSTSGWWSGTGAQIGIVQRILSKYSTDADRVYITGLSAGGMGTWASLISNPTMFAAAVPICGNGDTSKANLLINIPIWNFHSANDSIVGVGGSDNMINAIRAAGGNPIYTRYATGGHASWTPAYANPKTVPWVMAQRRNVKPANSPLLTITSPTTSSTFTTSAASVNLAGTTFDSNTLVTSIAWSCSRGGSGTASGSANWTASNIPLQSGDNLIQVIATGTSYSSTYGGVTTFNDTVKVTQTITPANTAPTISNIADQSTSEDTAKSNIAFTVGDAETAATSLTVSGSSSNTALVPNANIVFGGSGANRTVTVTPAANQNGSATITITVSDGTATASDTFVLTVTAVNDAPTISNIADRTIAANSNTGAIAFTIGDVETAAASLTLSGSSSNTALVPNANIIFGGSGASRTVTVTPAANQSGSATITITVSDSSAIGSDTFVLTVTAPPPSNVIAIDCGGTANYTAADGTIYKADAYFSGGSANNFVRPIAGTDDDALYQNYRWLSPSLKYAIPVANGDYAVTLKFADVYSTAAGQKSFDVKIEGALVADELDTYVLAGKDVAYDLTFAAKVADGVLDLEFLAGASGNPSINAILIKPRANRVPVATAQTITTAEDTARAITLASSDADGDARLYTILTQPAHGTLSGKLPNLTYVPAANYAGADSFTFRVFDGTASSAAATVSISVTAVNDRPTISNIVNVAINEDSKTAALPITVGDVETAATSLVVTTSSSNTALLSASGIVLGGSGANRTITLTPAANQSGSSTIAVTVSDGLLSASDTFVLTVNSVNDAPSIISGATATPNPATTLDAVAFSVAGADIEGDTLSYSWSFGDGARATGASVSHTYAAAGTYTASVTVSDGKGGQASSSISVTVNDPTHMIALKINFQQAASSTPPDYLADSGNTFGDRGNGYSYGWNAANGTTSRDRNAANAPDQRYDTLQHMQKPENPNARWEIALPNGTYTVRAVCGDPSFFDSVYRLNVEGTLTVSGTPTSTVKWFEGTRTVLVTDGALTISNGDGAANNKLCFVEIATASPAGGRELAASQIIAEPLSVSTLLLQMNFARSNRDAIKVAGTIPSLSKEFSAAGVSASIDVGAAIVNFTLDKTGRGRSAHGKFALKLSKTGGWMFQAALKGGSWNDEWADAGIQNATVKAQAKEIPVTLTLGGQVFGGSKAVKCTATKNKSGGAR
ncbi:MAG TPA: tandem-95 repeat protein [Planctomycetota bacterium]|nr:tandem-95 repeat protein [Planctomycetota bacterium]